ncbi:preprotein translocase subunit YajC [Janibacter sp. GXQ6167]|uniref:preprotein translocase subunit YajC n=1 Tax=Janibacter sp. GXQ6167 TaxID=3240791 RepID=UPI003525CA9A
MIALLTADQPAGPNFGSMLLLALPLLLIVFLMVSGRRRAKAAETFNASIEVGDKVVTTSGLYGTVRELTDRTAELELAPGTVVTIDRRAIGAKAPAAGPVDGTN